MLDIINLHTLPAPERPQAPAAHAPRTPTRRRTTLDRTGAVQRPAWLHNARLSTTPRDNTAHRALAPPPRCGLRAGAGPCALGEHWDWRGAAPL